MWDTERIIGLFGAGSGMGVFFGGIAWLLGRGISWLHGFFGDAV